MFRYPGGEAPEEAAGELLEGQVRRAAVRRG